LIKVVFISRLKSVYSQGYDGVTSVIRLLSSCCILLYHIDCYILFWQPRYKTP